MKAPEPNISHLFPVDAARPLADRLRPNTLDEVVGQAALLGPEGSLSNMLVGGRLSSLVLWGPPGCGKTTIARLIAAQSGLNLVALSAIFAGVSELKQVFTQAQQNWQNGKGTCLFIDEIHRFNKAQQDSFLPVLENGLLTLIGATTENPSFALNAALLSRLRVLVLKRLESHDLAQLIARAEGLQNQRLPVTDAARETLIAMADGDGRYLINMIETLYEARITDPIDSDALLKLIGQKRPVYDKQADNHYNLISALHKSLRGSDVDAALYWMGRMLEGGEDPLYLARRLVRFAYEDVGMADPHAPLQALAAWDTCQRLGAPEGNLALAQAVAYLATAPKSNAIYKAYKQSLITAQKSGSLMPPANILNAPTRLMKDIGYGEGYIYDHDAPDAFSGQNFFPTSMARQQLYQPVARGFERDIQKRLAYWEKLRNRRLNQQETD